VRYGVFIARDSSGAFAFLLRPGETLPNVAGLRFRGFGGYDTEDDALAAMVRLDRQLAIWGGKLPACHWPVTRAPNVGNRLR
jgi:hypothetical protein